MFTDIHENISPTIAAVATLLTIFTTALMLALEWVRGRTFTANHPRPAIRPPTNHP
jgi:ABC-type spermidine/putrescine transport system permease subunit II